MKFIPLMFLKYETEQICEIMIKMDKFLILDFPLKWCTFLENKIAHRGKQECKILTKPLNLSGYQVYIPSCQCEHRLLAVLKVHSFTTIKKKKAHQKYNPQLWTIKWASPFTMDVRHTHCFAVPQCYGNSAYTSSSSCRLSPLLCHYPWHRSEISSELLQRESPQLHERHALRSSLNFWITSHLFLLS